MPLYVKDSVDFNGIRAGTVQSMGASEHFLMALQRGSRNRCVIG
jgi:hypothetical protein